MTVDRAPDPPTLPWDEDNDGAFRKARGSFAAGADDAGLGRRGFADRYPDRIRHLPPHRRAAVRRGAAVSFAWSEYQDKLRLFSLAGFKAIRLEPNTYERPEGFDLQDWPAESLGIWREEPFDVEWRFMPQVVDETATYLLTPWLRRG
ncbi:MAG: hypothetical protein QM682_11685 [Paracoccus sp. (in: a-proteobacteria)]|uniref:hypothetical protein n=1 Tax=Paracoccus sp. TaxID=267 RepID=UPI0039E2E541